MLDLGVRRDQLIVLLIDDDLISREVTATVLTMNGYIVETADSGAASLEILAAERLVPDLVLMDAQMPGLSGTALIAEIRKRSRARILVLSGSDPSAQIKAAADGFLLKPFDAEALRALFESQRARPAGQAVFAANPDAPAINPVVLAQLRQLMPETGVREIYQAIVADLNRRSEELAAAIAREDRAEVRRIGHAIKGGCSMAGAQQAARLGALLEAIPPDSEGNQLDNSVSLLNDLHSATRALQGMLDAGLPA
ncbi:MAG TPA: response regulator [Terracidiphilus sp.]|jgi:CheY-like chemotaxis protein